MKRWWLLGSAGVLAGCLSKADGPGFSDGSTSATPTTTAADTEGQLFDDTGSQQPACCVNDKTDPFEGLSWVKIVAEPDAIGTCPEPTTEIRKAYAEMKPLEPHVCGACSCSPAVCTLPEGIHTNAAKCADVDGSIAVPFGPDPAAGWEGVCSEEGALPAGLQCGGEPCAQSVSVPTVPIAPCKPESAPAAPFPDPTWKRTALQCKIEPLTGEGCEPEHVCAPLPPEGFALCLYMKGEHPTCPAEYPAHMVFYTGVQDDRGCEACDCSPPEGGECMAIVSTFADAACGTLAGAVVVTDQDASCFDVVPGTALGSMEASMVLDVPGSCAQSGGAPFGSVVPAEPLTLCCQAEPEPPG